MLQLVCTLQTMGVTLRRRLTEDRGQTAAEYMGIIVIVALIIAAIAASSLKTDIASNITKKVQEIFNHS